MQPKFGDGGLDHAPFGGNLSSAGCSTFQKLYAYQISKA